MGYKIVSYRTEDDGRNAHSEQDHSKHALLEILSKNQPMPIQVRVVTQTYAEVFDANLLQSGRDFPRSIRKD